MLRHMHVFYILCQLALLILCGGELELPVLDITELPNVVANSAKTLVLFNRAGVCSSCEKASNVIHSVATQYNIAVYQIMNSAATYVDKVPTIVLFLGSTPVIYEGAVDDDSVSHFVMSTQHSRVLSLDDLNFEHLTQASTGSTTGDWLLVFRTSQCDSCLSLQSRLEAVSYKLQSRLSVAWINSDTDGQSTAQRLHITRSPQIVLIRQGKMYEYTSDKYDVTSISSFVVALYQNAPSTHIPSLPDHPLVFWSQVAVGVFVAVFALVKILPSMKKSPDKKTH